jgi:hypothetical protein
MNKHMRLLFPIISILLLSCSTPPEREVKSSIAAQPATSKLNFDFIQNFTGTINNKYNITMQLNAYGDSVNGVYFYQSKGEILQLRGSINADSSFSISEYIPWEYVQYDEIMDSIKMTGKFEGKYYGDSISGLWTSSKDNKKMGFRLVALSNENCSVTESSESVKTSHHEMKLPVFSFRDKHIQQKLNGIFSFENLTGFTEEEFRTNEDLRYTDDLAPIEIPGGLLTMLDAEVSHNKNCALSVHVTTEVLSAHFYQNNSYINLDLITGETIDVRNLIFPDKLKSFIALCNKKLGDNIDAEADRFDKEYNEYIHAESQFQEKDLDEFLLSEEGITFFFDFTVYAESQKAEQASNAVLLSNKELKGLIRKNPYKIGY